jgi:tetratricopeptide (TPR) repeat protein
MQIENRICLLCGVILIGSLFLGPATAADLTAEDYYNQGIDYASLQKYTDAIASYDNALLINPQYSNAWYNRGNAFLTLGQYSDAITSYSNATRINPDDSDAWYNRGNAFLYLDQYNDAIASYDKALLINPGYTDARQNLEVALKQKNPNFTAPTETLPVQPTPTMTLPPLNQPSTPKVPLIYAPLGAIVFVAALAWLKR